MAGKINSPINLQSVYAQLGIAPYQGCYDLAYLCSNRHGKINKWSKVKPIRYATPQALTTAQFAGTSTDHANGIHYGLRCRIHNGSGDGIQDGSQGWAGLHKCNWEYFPPVPGTHWNRLSDFDGYDDGAQPNPTGKVNGKQSGEQAVMYYDIPQNLPCSVVCHTSGEANTFATNLGVNLQEAAEISDIGEWYPCILISDVDEVGEPTSPHYVRALAEVKDVLTELNKYQPLRNSSGVWYGDYVAETYKNAESGTVEGGLNISTACKKIVTLFVKKDIRSASLGENYTQWRDVTDEVIPAEAVFTVPGATGIIVNYKRAYAQGLKFSGANAQALSGRVYVYVSADWVKEDGNMPDREYNYTFHVRLTTSSGETFIGAGQFTISGAWAYPDEQTGATPVMQVNIETTLLHAVGGGAVPIRIDWSVTSDKTGDRILNSGTANVTYNN